MSNEEEEMFLEAIRATESDPACQQASTACVPSNVRIIKLPESF